MEKIVLQIFQGEIKKQCSFAIIAIEQIKTGLSNNNLNLIWYAIQNFLVAVANISKFFWPTNAKYQKRGEELRNSLGIKNDSPIKTRKVRNCFEHFDEKLEEWAISSKGHIFIDSNIGPTNKMIVGIAQEIFLRNFNPTTWTLTFRGDKYELKPMIEVIHYLYLKVSIEENKPCGE